MFLSRTFYNICFALLNIFPQDCVPVVPVKEDGDSINYDALILFKDSSIKSKDSWNWALGFENAQLKESWLKEFTQVILTAKSVRASRH